MFFRHDTAHEPLRIEAKVVFIGTVMVVFGLILFYMIRADAVPETDAKMMLRMLKNAGTFIGLMGIGVSIAGILLYLISRNQPPINSNFDQQIQKL